MEMLGITLFCLFFICLLTGIPELILFCFFAYLIGRNKEDK